MNRFSIQHKRVYKAAIVATALLLSQSLFAADCADDWLVVDQIRSGNDIALRATNQQNHSITYSIRAQADGERSRSKPYRGTLSAAESIRIAVVQDQTNVEQELSLSCNWTIGNRNAVHSDDHLYRLPYADGKSYRVLQGFGSRFSHRGPEQYAVDFKMRVGTPVHAARGGVVARIVESNDKGCWQDGCGDFANFIVIMHSDGTTGEYYHLQQNGALVDIGEQVSAGQRIGLSGNTGHTALPHLHFAVYRATSRARSQSVPVNFISAEGVVYRPRRGNRYLAVAHPRTGD